MGLRRSDVRRRRRRWGTAGVAIAAAVAWGWGTPPARGGDRAAAAVAAVRPPVPVVELSGTGEQIGRAHGQRLKADINFLLANYLRPFLGNDAQRFLAMAMAAGFEAKMRPEHLAEVRGVAAGSGADRREVMLAQCFLDISQLMGCSTVALPADASPDHLARLGRNLDFPALDVADEHSVVFVIHPAGKYAYAAVGWPGMVGVLSGMNEHGLTLCNMEVRRGMRAITGMPYTLLYRTVLEECRTVDEAVALIQKTDRQTANNLMVMDAAGARAVIEIQPDGVVVRHGLDGRPLVSTNHQRGTDQDTPGRCWRYDLLEKVAKTEWGKIDVAGIEGLLKGVQQGHVTLQSMVFEPANRVVYLSVGEQAASGTFYRLDLKARLTGDDRPAAAAAGVAAGPQ